MSPAANPDEIARRGSAVFYRMVVHTRPSHVCKHVLNHGEAWWQVSEVWRSTVEAIVARFEGRGVPCGDAHDPPRRLPRDLLAEALGLHDEVYEPLYRLVIEDLLEGSDEVVAQPGAGKNASTRLDHTLLCMTLYVDVDGRVSTAYRTRPHPVSSGERQRARNHVRRARAAASLKQTDSTDQGGLR